MLKAKGEGIYAAASLASTEPDRLNSFKRDAVFNRLSPQKSLLTKFSKHILGMTDLIEIGSLDPEKWEDILTDIPNYIMLLEGLLEDLRNE
jgi:hypothetical protein